MKKHRKIPSGPPGRVLLPLSILSTLAISLSSCGLKPKEEKLNLRIVPKDRVSGEYIVGLNRASSEADSQTLKKNLRDKLNCQNIELSDLEMSQGAIESGLFDRQVLLDISNCREKNDEYLEAKVLEELEESDLVTSVEVNAKFKATAFSENDPLKLDQYYLRHMRRDKTCETLQGSSIRSAPVVIAVLDTGVVKDHPDLKNAFYQTDHGSIIGANFAGKGSSGTPDDQWQDAQGHGTHVAGIIAADSNNQEGTAGVASCRNIKIMPVKVLGDEGVGSSVDIQRGIDFAIENGADIINLSLGSNHTTLSNTLDFSSPIYDYAAKKGVIVVAASGNDGLVNGSVNEQGRRVFSFPSSYRGVISVAATDHLGRLTDFSNRGPLVDVAAPGYAIIAPYLSGYKRLNGTSMATPSVSASIALALTSLPLSYEVDTDHIESLLLKSVRATNLEEADVKSMGVIDSLALLENVAQ